jgi:hypothetical protein
MVKLMVDSDEVNLMSKEERNKERKKERETLQLYATIQSFQYACINIIYRMGCYPTGHIAMRLNYCTLGTAINITEITYP